MQAQNLFIGVWVNYEALRRNLDLDLGTMELDGEGLWVDPGPIRADTLGGNLGPAILNYGLTEDEMRLQQQMAESTSDAPVELRPTVPLQLESNSGMPLETFAPTGAQPALDQPPVIQPPAQPPVMLPVSYESAAPLSLRPQELVPPRR